MFAGWTGDQCGQSAIDRESGGFGGYIKKKKARSCRHLYSLSRNLHCIFSSIKSYNDFIFCVEV